MQRKLPAIVLLVFLVACAAQAAKLKLPAQGDYFYWLAYTDADGERQITAPTKVKGSAAEIDVTTLGEKPKEAALNVLDARSGNLAVHPLKAVDGKLPESIALKAADFDHVRKARIAVVSSKGRPVQSAVVTLTDAENNSVARVVTPESRGVADFEDVAAGTVTLKVECAGRKSINDVDIPLKRETAVFTTEVPLPGDVPTLAPEKLATGETTEPAKRRVSSPGVIVQTLLGLIFLAMLAYVIAMFAKAKRVSLADALRKAGVTFPGEAEAPAGAPAAEPQVDPSICPFCGQKKDPATGACACTVVQAPAQAASGPRLIGIAGPYMGKVFDLTSDVSTLGREPGNLVALVDDATASRRHARITLQDGQCHIQDEGSANGTVVNGVRITEPKAISTGDEIQIGGSRFRFEQ